MAKNDLLYCKGMDMSESEEEGPNDEGWNDTHLISAYDSALKMANVEVAKRLAMATNGKLEARTSKHGTKKQTKKTEWSTGMPCRAMYEEDRLEYEAFIVRILNDRDCIVKFLGYDNTEQVEISTLKPSHGKEAQQLQVEQALIERGDESDCGTEDLLSDQKNSVASTNKGSKKKKKDSKKKKQQRSNGFQLPMIPPMPNMNELRNMANINIPMPPPPMPLLSTQDEDQTISSMLFSWYMSGYYTGLYQGLKRSKLNTKQKE